MGIRRCVLGRCTKIVIMTLNSREIETQGICGFVHKWCTSLVGYPIKIMQGWLGGSTVDPVMILPGPSLSGCEFRRLLPVDASETLKKMWCCQWTRGTQGYPLEKKQRNQQTLWYIICSARVHQDPKDKRQWRQCQGKSPGSRCQETFKKQPITQQAWEQFAKHAPHV